jgi:PAS domain S-box-containing protein
LADAEQTLTAIGNDEVDALVVVTRSRGSEEVLTLDRAYQPYKHMVDHMRDGALTVSQDGTILHASRRFVEMAGIPAEAVVDTSLFSLVPEEEKSHLRSLLRLAVVAAQRGEFTLQPRAEGHVPVRVELSMSPLPSSEAGQICLVVAQYDWTLPEPPAASAVRARESALFVEYQRVAATLAQLPVGVVIARAPDGDATYANRRAEEIFRRRLVGADNPALLRELTYWRADGTIAEPEELPLARVLATRQAVLSTELAFLRGDGSMVFTRVGAAPLNDEGGKLVGVTLAFEDITQEHEARVARDENDRFRELFMGMLAHDLRVPLSVIAMSAARLLLGQLLPEDAIPDMRRIQRSSLQMGRMIGQLFQLTRSRLGGGIPITPAPVDLQEIARAVVDDFGTTHPRDTILLTCPGSVRGEWDGDRLAEVLFNLLSNALQHGAPEQPVRITVREDAEFVCVDVHNCGTIPREQVPFIFDPFRRAQGSTSRKSDGLGLGLYIAREIAHAHRGSLDVDSNPERGTTFTLTLPRSRSAAPL